MQKYHGSADTESIQPITNEGGLTKSQEPESKDHQPDQGVLEFGRAPLSHCPSQIKKSFLKVDSLRTRISS
jgi:hypothetical protein